MLPIALLAGGLATRLRPITTKVPKALVEVAGKPFIDWQLEDFSRQGISHVVLCTGYLGEQIMDHVGHGSRYGLEITYSPDGPFLLGTGGALKQALSLLGDHFHVVYGDSFLPINYGSVEQAYFEADKPALMTVLNNRDRWDKSNVHFENNRLFEYNKRHPREEMQFIDYGLGVLSAVTVMNEARVAPFDLADIYHELSINDQLAGYEVSERFYEIGSHQGLRETEDFLLNRKTI